MRGKDELGEFLQSWEDYFEGRIPYDDVLILGGNGRKMGDARINPWVGESDPTSPEWETVSEKDGSHPAVYRMRVPGGWLYRLGKSTTATFVPER
jgi:hypothetical protein